MGGLFADCSLRAVTDYEEEFCRFVPDAEIDDYHRRKTNNFDELVKMRGKLGKPFCFALRVLKLIGPSRQTAFHSSNSALTLRTTSKQVRDGPVYSRWIDISHRIVTKFKSDFAQEFPLDEPDSYFFSRTRKRLDQYYHLQDDAEAMNTSVWELAGCKFHYRVLNPFKSSDPRRDQFFTERESTPQLCHHAH